MTGIGGSSCSVDMNDFQTWTKYLLENVAAAKQFRREVIPAPDSFQTAQCRSDHTDAAER
jgi:hypothetical protein